MNKTVNVCITKEGYKVTLVITQGYTQDTMQLICACARECVNKYMLILGKLWEDHSLERTIICSHDMALCFTNGFKHCSLSAEFPFI